MEDFFDLDKLKAKVFLLTEEDTKNMAMVTDEKLMIVRDGKKMLFSLVDVKGLYSTNKKLLFPLILGGIVAPFGFLSYFTNMFHPLLHLLLTLIGLLLFYIGWAGRAGLLVRKSKGEEEIVYLPSISKNLLAFMDYINGQLSNAADSGLHNFIFMEVLDDNYNWLYLEQGQDSNFPCLGYTYTQLIQDRQLQSNVIAINPELAGREIRFVFDVEINEMRPQIDGPVNKSAIVKISDSDIL